MDSEESQRDSQFDLCSVCPEILFISFGRFFLIIYDPPEAQ
jgi:hypothetical protein